MDYSLFVWSTATFVETRLKETIEYSALEETVGFSYRHIREIFQECTGVSLSRYILLRRLANSAFEIVHTGKSLTEIASEYMFNSYDTFTRAFKRHTSYIPSDFRNQCCKVEVGRRRLLVGIYAPEIIKKESNSSSPIQKAEVNKMMKTIQKTDQSCILYGVPKVAYTMEECTPFCIALKSCLNYMGQQMDYAYIMATTGAGFRLRWNTEYWDGGNVDIMNIYEDSYEAFRRAFRAAGRSYQILKRENSGKKGFIQFIKSEIDEGRPVIALGMIGPPEACLITGYQNHGKTLLGWNCFQDNHEYAKGIEQDETGYFISKTWWENECTVALMSVRERQEELIRHKDIIDNAIDILTKEKVVFQKDGKIIAEFAGGLRAYDLWANAITDDQEFPKNAILPHLFERIMCQNDAQVMIGEGRSYAACFIEWIGKEHVELTDLCNQAANYFRQVAECAFKMNELKGGFVQGEQTTKKFAEPEVRKQIAVLIYKAKGYEMKACKLMKEIASKL